VISRFERLKGGRSLGFRLARGSVCSRCILAPHGGHPRGRRSFLHIRCRLLADHMRTIYGTYVTHTANEGPVRIQYKCMLSIYVFPVMKLLFLKQNYNVLSPSSYTHISVGDLYISRIGLPILLQGNMWT
jgi:hypothetical protein